MPAPSNEIVASARFDTSNFESNIDKAMNSLQKFEDKLNNAGGGESLSKLGDAAKAIDLSKLEHGIEQLTKRFSFFGETVHHVMENVRNKVDNVFRSIKEKMILDPFQGMSSGMSEYEMKMDSLKTIMSATGRSLEDVKVQLEELNKYSDETIYSFSDMTQNIGKFTNAGIKLEDAVAAMKGISNEAALSGANATEASRAMYNLSQAMSLGYMQRMDWKSIENANMATQDFKKNLAETATQVGTIKKVNDDLFQVGKKTYSLNALYVDALKEGWLTNDVMMGTLKNYADKSTDLGKRAYEAATQVSTFSKMMDTLRETMQSGWGKTWELVFGDLEEAKRLWSSINNVVSAAIDSIATQRNEILQIWHDNGGYDAFLETINNIINVVQSIVAPIKSAFKEVFGFVDGGTQKAADGLIGFTEGIRDFVRSLELSIDAQKTLREVFRVIFTALKVGIGLIKTAIGFIKPLGHILGPIVKIFFDIASGIGNFIFSLVPFNSLAEGSTSILEAWGNICKSLGDKITSLWNSFKKSDALKAFVDIITKFVKFISSVGLDIFSDIGESISELFSDFSFDSVISGFHWLIGLLTDAAGAAFLFADALVKAFKVDGIKGVVDGILHPIESVKNNLLSFTKDAKNGGLSLFDTIKNYIFDDSDAPKDIRYAAVSNPIVSGVYKLEDDTTESLSVIDRIKSTVENIGSGLADLFSGFVNKIKSIDWKSIGTLIKFVSEEFLIFTKSGVFIAIAQAIKKGVIVTAIAGLVNSVASVFNNFSNIFRGVGKILNNTADLINEAKQSIDLVSQAMAKKLRAEAFKENAKAIGIITIAVVALMAAFAGLVYVLKDVDYTTIGVIALAVVGITAGLALLAYAASKFVNSMAGLRSVTQPGPVDNGWQALNNFFVGITRGANSFLKNAGKGIKYAGLGVALTGAAAFMLSLVGALFLVRNAISSFAEMTPHEFKKGFKSVLLIVGLLSAAIVAVSLSTMSISKASSGKAMSKKNSLSSFIGVTAFIFALVAAINLMVDPIKQFAAIPKKDLIKGLLSIAATLFLLVSAVAAVAVASTILTAFKGSATGFGTFIGAAAFIFTLVSAVNLMADAIGKFADIKESTMKKGLRSIASVMLCISAAIAIISLTSHKGSFGGLLGSVGVILAFVGAIYLLIGPIKQLGAIDVDTLVKGVGAISVIVLAISAALAIIGRFGNFGAFAGLGIGLLSIVGALLILSIVPFDRLIPSAIALGIVLAALALAFRGASGVSGKISAFVGVAANIATITASLIALSMIKPKKLIAPVLVLGSMLFMLSRVFKAASGIGGDGAWKSFAAIVANIIVIIIALGVMANMEDQSKLVIATACIDSLLLMMSVLFKGASKINPASAKKAAAVIGTTGIVIMAIIGVLGLVAYLTKDVDYKNFAAIGFAAAAIGFAISKIMDVMQRSNGANFKILMARLLVIAGVIGMLSVLVLAIGAAASLAGNNTMNIAAIGAVLSVITAVVAGLMKVVEGTVAGANAKTLAARTLVLVGIFGMLSVLALAVGAAASVAGNNTMNIAAIGAVLSIITAVVIGLMAVIQHGNTAGIAKATLPLIAIFAGLSAIAVAIGFAASIAGDNTANIVALGTMLSLMTTVIDGLVFIIGRTNPQSLIASILPIIAIFGMLSVLAIAVAHAASIANGCTSEILAIGTMVSLLAGVMLLIVKLSPGVALAASAALGFVAGSAIIIAGLIAIASIIGYLDSLIDFRESMNEGLAIIADLAAGLGKAIGAFVGGIAEGVLERVGQGLSDFYNNSKAFWDGMESLDSGTVTKGIKAMVGAIMALGAAAFTDAAIQFLDIFGGNTIGDIGGKLVEFAGYMGQFDSKTKSIKNATRFQTISNAAKLLFEGLSSAPTSGGIIDLFVGSSDDIDDIGSGIETMGAAMNAFNEKTKGINPETIEPAANAMKVIFEALSCAPNDGGLIGMIVGNNSDITTMGVNLVNFGNCMSNFASTISHIKDPGAVESGCSAMETCFNALSEAPNSGGWLSAIVGDNSDISGMGVNLVNFGNCMSNFASVVGNMKQDNFVSGCQCMSEALKAMNEAPSLDGGFIGAIFGGEKDFTDLGEGLVSFGQAMADFSKVEGIDEEKVNKIISLMGTILTMQQTLANIGNTGTGDFETLTDAFKDACESMSKISDYDISYSDVNNACVHIEMLARAFKECVDVPSDAGAGVIDSIQAFGEAGVTECLQPFIESDQDIRKAVGSFIKKIGGVFSEGAFVAHIKKQAGVVVENVVLGLEEKTNLVLGRVEKLGFKLGDAYATGVGAGVGDDVEPGVPATEMKTVVDNSVLGLSEATDGALSKVEGIGSKLGESYIGGANDVLKNANVDVDALVKNGSEKLNNIDPSAIKDTVSNAVSNLSGDDLLNATGLNKVGSMFKEHTDSIEKQTKDHQTRMYNIKDTYQNTDIQRLEMYGLKTRNVTAEYLNANKSKYEKFGLDVDVIMGNLHTHTNNIAAKSSEDVTNKVSDTVNSVTDKANAGASNIKGAARSGGQGASEEVSKYSDIVLGKSESFWRAVQNQAKGGSDTLVNKGQSLKKFTAESFKQIDTLWTDFQNKLAEKTKSIKDSHSMFDEATKIDPKSPEQLQKNIDSQTNQLNRYANVMASLATKIEDKDLKEKIFSMDIDKLDILEGLNNMTEEQLKHYTESMTAYSKAAENAALASMGKEREELSKQMTALMGGLEFDYNDFAAIYDGTFNSLNKYAQDQLTKINIGKAISDGINAGKESGEIKAAVEDLLKTNIFDTADAVLGMSSDDRLAAKQIGAPIVSDIAEGIRNENNSTQAVGKAIEETVTDGAKTVGDSKSLKGDAKAATEEIGQGAMAGIADGVVKYDASLLTAAINKQLKTAMDGVQKKQEIGSPSKLWRREVGDNVMAGIYVATKDPYTVNALVGSIGNVLNAMLDASVDGISGVGNTLGKAFASEYGSAIQNGTNFDYRTVEDQAVTTIQRTVSAIMDSIDSSGMDLNPVITPVIDTSVVRRDAYAINSMLNRQYSLSMASSVAASNSRKENAKYVAKQRNEAVGDAIAKMANKPAEQVTNLYVDGIKYNTDEYVDGSISNFTDSIITMARMHSR